MIQINIQKGNTSCRDGPRLEMSNSTRTDHCGSRTAMVTSLNSIVRSSANGSAETAVLATDAKLAGFNANVRNDCSTVTTNHQTGRSPQHMLFSGQRCQKWSLLLRNQQGRHGSHAMTGILTIAACECEKTHWLRLCQGWGSRNGSLRLNRGSQLVRRDF